MCDQIAILNIDNGILLECPDNRCKAVNIPNGVLGISDRAFLGCDKLESVDIPFSVTSIGTNCFDRCRRL